MENNTVFVLLAGGKSERMGVAKGLLKYQQTYWILEQLHRISKSSINEVFIGLGYNFQHYFNAIPWLQDAENNFVKYKGLKVKIVINKNPEHGSFSTLQTVLKEIPKASEVVLNHIDIPILNAKELTQIISTNNEIVKPNYKGKNGHPIKMKKTFWINLISLDVLDKNTRLDVQLKKVNPAKISTIKVFDRVIILNLNTKKDWVYFLENSTI